MAEIRKMRRALRLNLFGDAIGESAREPLIMRHERSTADLQEVYS